MILSSELLANDHMATDCHTDFWFCVEEVLPDSRCTAET